MSREIDDLDFNSLRTKIIETLGSGSGTYGYGQQIQSSPVYQGNIITKAQWDGLRYDLINILLHQTGVTPNVIEVARGDRVSETNPLETYNDLIEAARTTRFDLAASQSSVTSIATKTYNSAWNTYAYTTVRLNFTSAETARYFFNSGGKIRLSSSRTGGSPSAQNGAWTTVLNNAGSIEVGGNTSPLNFYQLTNSYQTVYEQALSTPYSSNVYKIKALCNVSNNSTGTATSVTFEITWTDNYSESFPNSVVNPPDQVDGTLSFNVEEIKAAGSFQPSGSFTINSPTYDVSEISAGFEAPPPPPPPAPEPPPAPAPDIGYNEIVTVPSTVVQNTLFAGTVTGGAPNTSFTARWTNSSGTVMSSGTAVLDGSGNYNSGSIGSFAEPGVYTLRVIFSYTGNVRFRTTTVVASPAAAPPPPPPCQDPPDTQDSLAIYRNGMVLIYTRGRVQRDNTLVRSTKTSNATTVNGWYRAILNRPADPEGLNFWVGRLNSGANVTTTRNEFVAAANAGELAAFGKVLLTYTFCNYQQITG